MDLFLQIVGGLSALLNKIFLSQAEGRKNEKIWRLLGWWASLIGVPAWTIIFALKHDWMAAAVDFGATPSIILGLVIAHKGLDHSYKKLEKFAKVFTYFLLSVSIAYSLYDFGGITSLSQFLEIGLVAGFLIGSYLLAKKKRSGWLWFFLMNVSTAILTATQGKYIFAAQQVISLYFVVRGFLKAKSETKTT